MRVPGHARFYGAQHSSQCAMMEITPLLVFLGLSLGFLVGVFAALSGTGGGSLNVPIFDAVLGIPFDVAQGTSSFVIFINSWSTNLAYYKQKRVDYRSGAILLAFSAPMAIVGALVSWWIASFEQEGVEVGKTSLKIVFYIFIIFVGLRMLFKKKADESKQQELLASCESSKYIIPRKVTDCDGTCFEHALNLKKIIPMTILAGFLSGFFGIGGGLVQVPMFNQMCGMSIHLAVATSGFMILFNSFTSTITRISVGNVDLLVGILFSASSVIGAQLGARIAKGTSRPGLKKIIAIILIALSVYKIFSTIINS
ncbi:TSUP family transporter [Candidatus Bathyarchaeota archaeon]|nr:TSUP family transporter [Candidatus Bathyarchaeota archaeon]